MKTLAFVMDNSGSMVSFGDETFQSFESLVKDAQKAAKESGTDFKLTLVTCGNAARFICKSTLGSEIAFGNDDDEVKKVAKVILNKDDFRPAGMTSLHDAICMLINHQKEIGDVENVIMTVISDGFENNSKEYNINNVRDLSSEMQEKNKWKIVYLGANQDSYNTAQDTFGLKPLVGCCSNFAPTAAGMNDIMSSLTANLSRAVSATNERVENFLPSISSSVPVEIQQESNHLFGNPFPFLQPMMTVSPQSFEPTITMKASLTLEPSISHDFEIIPTLSESRRSLKRSVSS